VRVRSKQEGEALQFTGGRDSAKEIADLVGSLGKVRHRPARSGASPAIPAQPESIFITMPPAEGQRQKQTVTVNLHDWLVKTKGRVTAYPDASFQSFWESATIVEQVPADAYQEPHKAAPDPDQEVTSDDSSDEEASALEAGSGAEDGASEAAGDERDLDPPDQGDLLPDEAEEGGSGEEVVLADEVGQPGEVGGTE
jgi:hypothetical protein